MPAGLDNLDFAVLCALALAVVAYLGRDTLKNLFTSDNSLTNVTSDSRDLVEVVKENGKNFVVLFASQTGTGEDYARKFAKELISKFQLKVMCADVEKYDFDNLHLLPSSIPVSFFVSTYGEGDFPDGALPMEEYLSGVEEGSLSNLKYTLFGLGNSTYEFFNGASKKTEGYLKAAGAHLIGTAGLADDGAGTTDEDYLSWKEATLEALKDVLRLDEHEEKFEPAFKYEELEQFHDESVSQGEPNASYLPINSPKAPFTQAQPFLAPIVKSKELFKDPTRNCIHAEISLEGSNLKYTTGDHIGILPSNSDEHVKQFLETFNLKPHTVFDLISTDPTSKPPFPVPCSIGAAVRHYIEITGPVSRATFGQLVEFAPNEEVKNKLSQLAKDKDDFAREITAKHFNFADAVLYVSGGKPWTTVPWNFLVETLPHMQPRYYSISSSSTSEPETVHITAVVENEPNTEVEGKRITGVTTNVLRNIELVQNKKDVEASTLPIRFDLNGPRNLYHGFKLPIHIRHSQFRLPSNPSTPVIMVGPGTGVAPFRGFIRERCAYKDHHKDDSEAVEQLGKHILFYGSRSLDDYLYSEEWPEYAKKLGESFELVVAHSRLNPQKKVYVQDLLIDRAEDIFKLIKEGAFIYVCGDAKGMAQGVHKALVQIVSQGNNISEEDAAGVIKMMKTTGKYQEDGW